MQAQEAEAVAKALAAAEKAKAEDAARQKAAREAAEKARAESVDATAADAAERAIFEQAAKEKAEAEAAAAKAKAEELAAAKAAGLTETNCTSDSAFVPCQFCGRTFFPDRLPVHLRVCKKKPRPNGCREITVDGNMHGTCCHVGPQPSW